MQNLKIKLNSESEAEEVKCLAVKAGYKLDALFGKKWSAEFCYLLLCEDMSAGFGNELMADGDKPLSIGELRAMANPVKEYLTKNNHGNYELVYQKWRNDDIEIPEGANYAYNNDLGLLFMPSEIGFNHPLLVWQREQDEPFLTPECTLNDQYAEIEQVRQVEIHGTVKVEPDLNFGAAQASGGAKDNVNHPSHYADSAIECIDAMEAMMTPEQFIGYLRGNLFKYQWRYEKKNGIEDLKKAQWYLEKLTVKVAKKNAPF